MVDSASSDRLQPSLLDRLLDDNPDAKEEGRGRRVLSTDRLKKAVIRDLNWLLNTASLDTVRDLSEVPHVSDSVLNYGVPDITGITGSSVNPSILEDALRERILAFEPRLIPASLSIRLFRDTEAMNANALVMRVEGQLWSDPNPMAVLLQSSIDLETGTFTLKEGG